MRRRGVGDEVRGFMRIDCKGFWSYYRNIGIYFVLNGERIEGIE